jgi:hypothetical protein
MTDFAIQADEWLTNEDNIAHEDRLARIQWLASLTPTANYLRFEGGWLTKSLYEEARYSFVYAQFLSVIMLGLSFIEHTLAAIFYASGRNDLQRASISTLLQEAVEQGWLTPAEFENLDHAREIRNRITHFRPPLHDHTIEYRAVTENEMPYTLIESDARHVMEALFHLVGKTAI